MADEERAYAGLAEAFGEEWARRIEAYVVAMLGPLLAMVDRLAEMVAGEEGGGRRVYAGSAVPEEVTAGLERRSLGEMEREGDGGGGGVELLREVRALRAEMRVIAAWMDRVDEGRQWMGERLSQLEEKLEDEVKRVRDSLWTGFCRGLGAVLEGVDSARAASAVDQKRILDAVRGQVFWSEATERVDRRSRLLDTGEEGPTGPTGVPGITQVGELAAYATALLGAGIPVFEGAADLEVTGRDWYGWRFCRSRIGMPPIERLELAAALLALELERHLQLQLHREAIIERSEEVLTLREAARKAEGARGAASAEGAP